MSDFIETVNENTQKALKVLRRIDAEKKFSEFAREKFNEAGISATSTKAEEMLEDLHEIVTNTIETRDPLGNVTKVKAHDAEVRIKAVKVFAEMVGGGLNEKQTNIQNNNYGNIFLDMLSNKK